ncbi:DnaB-like helicase N-terminal domain-containing protein, partial [Morganella morganii]|uniref:DnaB-like helicase N-terminal domain-containing protein n=1 Tax=Morganella morganii TaxID=582 RepID=UPI0023683DE7
MTGNNFNQVPQSLEAEQSVIGALLLDPQGDRSQMVLSRLQPEMFYQISHRQIYEAIRELNRSGKPIDLITVTSALESAGQLTLAGGFSYVAEINHRTPSAANIVAYANTVRDKAVERQAIEKAGEIQRLFTEASVLSLAEKIDMAQTMLSDVVESSKTGRQS